MDGRKNNRGKIGNKGGRKSKAEELGLPALIDEVVGEAGKKKLISILYEQAKKGSFPHHQMLMHYMYGKPVEHKSIDKVSEILIKYSDDSGDLISPAT